MKHFRDALAAFTIITCLSLLAGAAQAAPTANLVEHCKTVGADPCADAAIRWMLPSETLNVRTATTWTIMSSVAPDDLIAVCPVAIEPASTYTACPAASIVFARKCEAFGTCAPLPPAEGIGATLDVSWTLPTQATDGTPLTGSQALTGIQLFVSSSPIPDNSTMAPTATFSGDMVQATYNGTVTSGTTLYARVKAVSRGGISDFSAQASKLIEEILSRPGVPTNVAITLTILPKVAPAAATP